MKLSIALFIKILCFLLNAVQAQKINDGYYFFNGEWKSEKEKKATYLLQVRSIGDSCKQFRYYHIY
jgi:hypothetical protein